MIVHDPQNLGFSPERLSRINALAQRYVDGGLLAGIITLVARQGKVVHFETCGLRDNASEKPMQADTIFRIYSMTKSITSAALMMLFEQGLVRLADPVSQFIPDFKNVKVYGDQGALVEPVREITLHDLLMHTSGLSYGESDETPVDALYDKADLFNKDITLEEMVHRIATLPLVFQPGTQWHYSVATDVVGRVVEVVSGLSLSDFFAEKILRPLNMTDTAFSISPDKVERLATLYAPKINDEPIMILDQAETSEYLPPVKGFRGGSGLLSTMPDYFRFCQCLLNKGELDGVRLLGRKTIDLMTANHLPPALTPLRMGEMPYHGTGFGLGFGVVVDVTQTGQLGSLGDYGWGGYAETYFWIDPVEEVIGISMTQSLPSATYPIRREFKTVVNQALIS
jgi:CubicO group peptidase (beta-lactamase class C family)